MGILRGCYVQYDDEVGREKGPPAVNSKDSFVTCHEDDGEIVHERAVFFWLLGEIRENKRGWKILLTIFFFINQFPFN